MPRKATKQQKNLQETHPELLNFRFSRAPPPQQQQQQLQRPRSNSGSAGGRSKKPNARYDRRTAEDRASARRRAASNMFPLHSSPDHAFVITRKHNQQYTFRGHHEAVSWEAVRSVKTLVPVEIGKHAADEVFAASCPICLEKITCPRITKCGHYFCLPCLIHHVQSSELNHPTKESKCPCCLIPLHLQDIRPVEFVTTVAPTERATVLKFVKLHRARDCPSPYLPLPDQPRRMSPHALPQSTDTDAPFCRFNYVDPDAYGQLLERNHLELLAMESDTNPASGLESLCIGLALQMVEQEQHKASIEASGEKSSLEEFESPESGICLQHPLYVFPNVPDGASGNAIVSSANSTSRQSLRRDRGDSVTSYGTESACSIGSFDSFPQNRSSKGGSMFLDEDESVFYQAEDGSLCFLSGFNMNCLRAEFACDLSSSDLSVAPCGEVLPQDQKESSREPQPINVPLPDKIEGKVLQVEHVHLTKDFLQRRRFLSHLPLYTDISLVELDIRHLLSNHTKKLFKKEFQKRNQTRINKINAKKQEDERLRKEEEARINDLKSRYQRIDPNDEFFQPVVTPRSDTGIVTGDDFGPSLSTAHPTSSGQAPVISFSQACRAREDFPSLRSQQIETNFPALGSSPPAKSPVKTPGISASANAGLTPPPAKGKSKGKKIVLFSTSAHRGNAY